MTEGEPDNLTNLGILNAQGIEECPKIGVKPTSFTLIVMRAVYLISVGEVYKVLHSLLICSLAKCSIFSSYATLAIQ